MALNLYARLTADNSGFRAALQQSQGMAASVGRSIGNSLKGAMAGFFSVGVVSHKTREMIEWGSRIHDTALRIGVSTDAMQELEYAAKMTGANIDDIIKGFRGLSKARETALGGGEKGKEMMDVFKLFGIDEEALRNAPLEQLFKRIGETIRTTDFGGSEIALVDKLLGKSGDALITAFREDLLAAAQEFHDLGGMASQKVIDNLDRVGDKFTELGARLRGPFGSVLVWLADRLKDIWDYYDVIIGSVGSFIGGFFGTEGSVLDKFKFGAEMFAKNADQVLVRREKEEAKQAEKEKGLTQRKEVQVDSDKDEKRRLDKEERDRKRQEKEEDKAFRLSMHGQAQVGELGEGGNFLGTRVDVSQARTYTEQLEIIKRTLIEINNKTLRDTGGTEYPA